MIDLNHLFSLATALGIGLLIGLERGWKEREGPEGSRIAGFRTFGLIGFLGGMSALADQGTGFVLTGGLIGTVLLLRQGYKEQLQSSDEASVTTLIAALLTYALGAVAVLGHSQIAAMGGVVTAFVLWLRVPLHAFLDRLSEAEISAFLRWLLITIVVLPLLPDENFGPFESLNPRSIWLMVVLISGLSFFAFLGIKWLGQRGGLLLTAFLGGLISSTAVTLAIARLVRAKDIPGGAGLAALCLSWMMMLARTAIVVGLIAPVLLIDLGPVLIAAMIVIAAVFVLTFRRLSVSGPSEPMSLNNPVDLREAATFALVLSAALMLSKGVATMLGPEALLFVSALTGAVDIEAVSLSVTRLAGTIITDQTATLAIAFAVFANTVFKGVLFLVIGKGQSVQTVSALVLGTIAAGAGVLVLGLQT
ncbi:MAG: DUF4010 domain-containing protein [Henriciella sp.]|nr:DUF4010 domain-containing protein [Henriciella sp.]